MGIRSFLSKMKLRFEDSEEEGEFFRIKLPLLKDFFTYLLICMVFLLIPFALHFIFVLKMYTQGYMAIGILLIAIILFLARKHFNKYVEYIVIAYLLVIVVLVIVNLGQVLLSLKSCESFYGGYAFALLHRMIGYRVIRVHMMIIFHFISLILRLIILYDHTLPVTLMVSAIEVSTICLSFKSEKGERILFDSLYRSKKQLLKFKDMLTEHLPNQLVIFSKDYSSAYFMNKAFKLCFQCPDIFQLKCSLKALIIEKESIIKNMAIFARLGYIPDMRDEPLSLSRFMWLLSKKLDLIRGSEGISFQVFEDLDIAGNPFTASNVSNGNDSEEESMTRRVERESSKKNAKNRGTNSKAKCKIATTVRGRPEAQENLDYQKEKRLTQTEHYINTKTITFEPREDSSSESNESEKEKSSMEGKGRIFKVKIFLSQWDDEEVIALMLDDMTQQRTLMELKMAHENKDHVVAMISHELRTPLSGILGLIDIVKKKVNDTEVLSYLGACKNNGLFLLNLVNSIIDLNQLENNKLRLNYANMSLAELLKEMEMLFEPFIEAKKLLFKINVAPNVPDIIKTDKNRLSQILINLLDNAFKFTFEGGITINIILDSQVPCRVKFQIQYTGLGIKKEDKEKLFSVFGKLEQTDGKVNTNGMGLGLAISNSLATLLDGNKSRGIAVDSELTKGSSFSFVVQCKLVNSMEEKSLAENYIHDVSAIFAGVDKEEDEDEGLPSINRNAPCMSYNAGEIFKIRTCEQIAKPRDSSIFHSDKKIESKENFSKPSLAIIKEMSEKQDEDKEWCLIVDDNPFNLMVARHLMEEKGFQVKTALNGKEAVEQVIELEKQKKVLKVILMDCQMPIMDGYEVTKILKRMMKAKEIGDCPIVALTAQPRSDEQGKMCKKAGMIDCMTKPLQVDELKGILKALQKGR